MDAEEVLPYRHIWRITGEYQFSGHGCLNAIVPGEITGAVVFLVIARVSSLDWVVDGKIGAPARISRRNSITSLAEALGRPFETIRRHVRALERDGLVTADSGGVALAARSTRADEIRRFLESTHDAFVRMIEQLVTVDLPRVEPRGDIEPAVGELLIRAIDMRLSPHERFAESFGTWHLLAVWGAIAAANARPIVLDPVLSRRYAFDPTPDALRRPVSLHAIAHAIDLPYATVWRQAQLLERSGVVTRGDDGWVVANRNLADAQVVDALLADAHFIMRKLRELTAMGLDPQRIDRRYIHGRPPLIELYPASTVPAA